MTRLAAPLLIVVATGPYLTLEVLGGRAQVAALTGGDPAAIVMALAYLAAWAWAVLATMPVLITLAVWFLPRLPKRRARR